MVPFHIKFSVPSESVDLIGVVFLKTTRNKNTNVVVQAGSELEWLYNKTQDPSSKNLHFHDWTLVPILESFMEILEEQEDKLLKHFIANREYFLENGIVYRPQQINEKWNKETAQMSSSCISGGFEFNAKLLNLEAINKWLEPVKGRLRLGA